jgi:hypothetical protein
VYSTWDCSTHDIVKGLGVLPMTILNSGAGKTAPELRSEFDHLMLIFAIRNAKSGSGRSFTHQILVTVASRTRFGGGLLA